MKVIFVLTAVLLLQSCALQTLKKGLPQLVGQPIETAIDLFGLPNGQMHVAGLTVYEWSSQASATIPLSQANTTHTTGTIGSTPIRTSTTTFDTNYIPMNFHCRIKLAVNAKGIITRWEYFGNQGGCERYADGVEQLELKQ